MFIALESHKYTLDQDQVNDVKYSCCGQYGCPDLKISFDDVYGGEG
jgi:hypothetical protein